MVGVAGASRPPVTKKDEAMVKRSAVRKIRSIKCAPSLKNGAM